MLTTVGLFIPYRYNVDQANAVWNDPTPLSQRYRTALYDRYVAVAQNIRTTDLITLGALGALAIAGILQGEIDFKPSFVSTRKRKTATIWPNLSPLPGSGAFVGLGGRF